MSGSLFEDFQQRVAQQQAKHPEWRYGQTVFNVLYFDKFDAEYADSIRGGDFDPFYVDERVPHLLAILAAKWAGKEPHRV